MSLLTNLISYWKLDEASGNAADAHGSNTLTDTGGVGTAAGKINGGRDFEQSSSQYFNINDNAALSTGDIDFTFAAWVKLESKATDQSILSKSAGGGNLEYWMYYAPGVDRFHFRVSPDGSSTVDAVANNFGSPSTGTWYFIVGWHDSVNNTLNVQVNNGAVNSVSHGGGVIDAAAAFRIGGDNLFGFWFDGLIDEVGFWKRTLTTQERTDLYNSGNGLAYPFTAPPNITTTSLPGGTTGVSYSQTLGVTGGSGSITWSIVSGNLPTGLSLNSSTGAITGTPTVAGTYNFTVRATDTVPAFDEQALSIVISTAPPAPSNNWKNSGIVPMANLAAWHMYDPAAGLSANNLITDFSGNVRHVTAGAGNAPVLTPNLLNGHHGWYFNGSRDPLLVTSSFTLRHLFVVASFEKAAFTGYEGLYGFINPGNGDILVADLVGGDELFDFSSSFLNDVTYRKSEVVYANSAAKAPMSGNHALIELIIPSGAPMDGISIGQQSTFTARKLNGWFFESLAYTQVQADVYRRMIYEYIAMKYFLWSKNAAGKDVWPFQPNWVYPVVTDKRIIESRAVSGAYKGRQKASMKDGKALKFETRIHEEHDAAKAFWNGKHPGTSFIYRDYAYTTPRDEEVRFVGPVAAQFNDYNDIDYSIPIEQV